MIDEPLYESPWTAKSEWWVLNPGPFVDICFDLGIERFAFTEKLAKFIPNMRMNPEKLLQVASRGRPWRAIIVEADNKTTNHVARVAVEYGPESWFERPVGVYPIWSAEHHSLNLLEEMCEWFEVGRPIGRFFDDSVDMRIVEGQDKRILFRSMPVGAPSWNSIFKMISQIKSRHPDVIFHNHGGKSVARTIGMGVDAFDHPTRLRWVDQSPVLLLPNGQSVHKDNFMNKELKLWSGFIGRSPQKIFEMEDRAALSRAAYEFNLLSLKWLSANYDKVWSPGIGGLATDEGFDHEVPDVEWQPKDDLVKLPERLKRERFDRWLCDVCSIAVSCPYARPGAVCIVEDAPTAELVTQFKSRRASDITEGLARLLEVHAERLNRGLQYEIDRERIDPNVTKLIDSMFDRGVQLARLRDPSIAAQMSNGNKVQIGIATQGGSATTILQASNSAELMAGVAARLEEEGIAIEDATEDDVKRIIGAIETEARG